MKTKNTFFFGNIRKKTLIDPLKFKNNENVSVWCSAGVSNFWSHLVHTFPNKCPLVSHQMSSFSSKIRDFSNVLAVGKVKMKFRVYFTRFPVVFRTQNALEIHLEFSKKTWIGKRMIGCMFCNGSVTTQYFCVMQENRLQIEFTLVDFIRKLHSV